MLLSVFPCMIIYFPINIPLSLFLGDVLNGLMFVNVVKVPHIAFEFSPSQSQFLCPIMPTAPDNYAIFLSPLPKNRLCRSYTSPHGQSRVERTLDSGVVCPCPGFFQPRTCHGGLCNFYKVDSLAVATRISHNYQVLLDDGNRIVIPQGNFKFFLQKFCIHPHYCSNIVHPYRQINLFTIKPQSRVDSWIMEIHFDHKGNGFGS